MSMKEKAMVFLAGIGVYTVAAGALAAMYGFVGYYVILYLGVPSTDMRVLTSRMILPYLALVPAGMLVGWLIRTRAWLYGFLLGIVIHWPGAALTTISLLPTKVALYRDPANTVYAGPGTPSLGVAGSWFVMLGLPAILAPALAALGSFLGQRLYEQARTGSSTH